MMMSSLKVVGLFGLESTCTWSYNDWVILVILWVHGYDMLLSMCDDTGVPQRLMTNKENVILVAHRGFIIDKTFTLSSSAESPASDDGGIFVFKSPAEYRRRECVVFQQYVCNIWCWDCLGELFCLNI